MVIKFDQTISNSGKECNQYQGSVPCHWDIGSLPHVKSLLVRTEIKFLRQQVLSLNGLYYVGTSICLKNRLIK